ncbi:MAG: hypothetical protein WC943_09570 [Elusimicrobiota bacterium]|jgi:hypothetical protein
MKEDTGHELLWQGTKEEVNEGFAVMRRNVLRSGRTMTVDQLILFIDSFWKAIGPQPRKRFPASYDRMLI